MRKVLLTFIAIVSFSTIAMAQFRIGKAPENPPERIVEKQRMEQMNKDGHTESYGLQSDRNVPSLQYKYCEIVGTGKFMSFKVNIQIDYGQVFNMKETKSRILVDENGKQLVFNSMVDAMNVMGSYGWEFVQAYAVGDAKDGYVYHWLLKKDLSKFPEGSVEEIWERFQPQN